MPSAYPPLGSAACTPMASFAAALRQNGCYNVAWIERGTVVNTPVVNANACAGKGGGGRVLVTSKAAQGDGDGQILITSDAAQAKSLSPARFPREAVMAESPSPVAGWRGWTNHAAPLPRPSVRVRTAAVLSLVLFMMVHSSPESHFFNAFVSLEADDGVSFGIALGSFSVPWPLWHFQLLRQPVGGLWPLLVSSQLMVSLR